MRLFETGIPTLLVVVGAAAVAVGGYIYGQAKMAKKYEEEKDDFEYVAPRPSAVKAEDDGMTITVEPPKEEETYGPAHEDAPEMDIENYVHDTDADDAMKIGRLAMSAGGLFVLVGLSRLKKTIAKKDEAYEDLLYDIYGWREMWASRATVLANFINSATPNTKVVDERRRDVLDTVAVMGEVRFKALYDMINSLDGHFKSKLKKAGFDSFTWVDKFLLDKYADEEDYEL